MHLQSLRLKMNPCIFNSPVHSLLIPTLSNSSPLKNLLVPLLAPGRSNSTPPSFSNRASQILPYGSSCSAMCFMNHFSVTTSSLYPSTLHSSSLTLLDCSWECPESLLLIWSMSFAQYWLLSTPLFYHHCLTLLTGKLRHLSAYWSLWTFWGLEISNSMVLI